MSEIFDSGLFTTLLKFPSDLLTVRYKFHYFTDRFTINTVEPPALYRDYL